MTVRSMSGSLAMRRKSGSWYWMTCEATIASRYVTLDSPRHDPPSLPRTIPRRPGPGKAREVVRIGVSFDAFAVDGDCLCEMARADRVVAGDVAVERIRKRARRFAEDRCDALR